jgi:hypothetical protein
VDQINEEEPMTTRSAGERPSAYEIAQQALTIAQALAERLEAVEARLGGSEDGAPPAPLGPTWKPLKVAAAISGYSPSMLRKASKGGRAPWWEYRGPRVWVDTATCPRRR